MIVRILCFGAILALAGCSGNGGGTTDAGSDSGLPDPSFVYHATGQTETTSDAVFLQERPTLYRTTEALGDLDVRALALAGDTLYAATASGLFRHREDGDRFERVVLGAGDIPLVDLSDTLLADGRLAVAAADQVVLIDPAGGGEETVAVPGGLSCLAAGEDVVWTGGPAGLGRVEAGAHALVDGTDTYDVRDLALDTDGAVWMATTAGLVRYHQQALATYDRAAGALPDDDVRAVAALPGGGVLAGCATGAARVGTAADAVITAGKWALPCDDITSVAASSEHTAYGHGIGATVVAGDFDHVDHHHSLRWIPAERVTDVALAGARRRWIATPAGIARIELEESTLAQKAALFEQQAAGFWRLDFVSDDGSRQDPWDLDEPIFHHDHDNDGLWTHMQIVAWCYAAAATGDETYCDKARRAMGAMMDQIDIPAISFEAAGRPRGFVTRSFVRDDEGEVYTSKQTQDNWHLVEDFEGHDYYWKDDTSSDETTGHFFGYPVFYDLCARDDAERAELADHAGALARHILDNGLQLIDLDGEKTTHGHWNPDRLAIALDGLARCMEAYDLELCAEARYGGGWLNAIEILGHMLAAWHMTGEEDFYRAYQELVEHCRYGELVDFKDDIFTVTKRTVANHSDHELAMLAYHTLIRYEPDDDRRERWIQSLLDMYQWEIPERNPLWSAIIAGFVTDGYQLDDAIDTLRVWPEDWREWLVDNSHRKDATPDTDDRHGDAQFKEVLPYDEIRTLKWNSNPYAVSRGSDGRPVQAPWPWLLPYWMYRYHGVIE